MPVCEVCDQTGGEMEVFFGYTMHTTCAPAYWVKDRRESEEFMAKARGK